MYSCHVIKISVWITFKWVTNSESVACRTDNNLAFKGKYMYTPRINQVLLTFEAPSKVFGLMGNIARYTERPLQELSNVRQNVTTFPHRLATAMAARKKIDSVRGHSSDIQCITGTRTNVQQVFERRNNTI